MTWLDLAWAAVMTLCVTGVVGVGVAWCVGLRGFWLVAAAPPFALTVVAGAAIVAPFLGIAWSILPVLLVALVIAGGSLLVRWLLRRSALSSTPEPHPSRGRFDAWILASLIIAIGLLTLRFVQIFGAPEAVSQTFDVTFHLNGVRFILDTANASSLHLGQMTSPGGGLPFYPAAWHAWVSLIVQLTGVTIPVATNAFVLVVSAVYWPVTVLLLVRTLLPGSRVALVATGALAAAIPAFPILLYDYGVLYPFLLGLAVLPFALAVAARMLGVTAPVTPRPIGWWWLVLAGALVGMTLAHPGAFVAFLALSLPLVAVAALRRWRRADRVGRWWLAAAVAGYLVAGALLVLVLRPPPEARGWPISMSMAEAAAHIFGVSMWYRWPAFVVAAAIVAGIVWAIVRRTRADAAILGMYLVAAWLFFVVAAFPERYIRDAFTGSWYNNLPRVAAILAIAMVPLAALGVDRTWRWIASLLARTRFAGAPAAVRGGAAVIAALALIVVSQITPQQALPWAAPLYAPFAWAPLLDPAERALIGRLAEDVPADTVLAGKAATGAGLAYALSGIRVLEPHVLIEVTPDIEVANAALASGSFDAEACAALDRLGVRYVLDFGQRGVHGEVEGFPGLTDSDGVRIVDQEGDLAFLYEITACS